MARINFAKNFAGEIYATQTWVEGKGYATETFVEGKGYATTSYVDVKISGLGNVFELKGLVETLPAIAEIGDVYLVNETVDGQTFTAEYVYTETGFEKLGIATSTNSYATKSYVDTTFATKTDVDSTFVKATQFKSGKGATATAGTDDNGNTLTVEAKVSTADGNRLSLTDNGLFVPAIVASDVRGFISVEDTDTIDMNYVDGKITANAIGLGLKGDAGNSFAIANNATTVWAAISALDGVVNTLQGGGEGQEGIISRVEKVEALSKKNARNIVDLDANIKSVNTTVSAIIDDNESIKTSVNGAISDIDTVKSGVDGAIADITKLESGVNATIADIATVKGSVNGAISDIAKLETGVNGAIADVKKVVTELADVATLKSKSVTLSKQDGVATAKMEAGEIVFAVLDANNQVYPDVDYAADGATLTANYGEQTIPDTWTVWYGKVATFTTPSTSDVEATSTVIGDLTAASVDATATVNAVTTTAIGELSATDATMENIETYVDTELN